MKCPNCEFDSPREMHFCGMCGTRLTNRCLTCGFGNPPEYRFCGLCGTRLISDETEPALPPRLPATAAAPPASPIEAERRDVTVVITDLTDSTNLLEQTGTEGWVELMNRILHILESEVTRFGGEISQFRGDGLVAFFGATAAHEDDPERAVLAALSMQRAFEQHRRELPMPAAAELRMRVGLDTGEVIVSTGVARQQWQEAAMGHAVTIAARMETAAEPGTILVSENTYQLARAQFDWQPLGEIQVKGVRQPIAVYRPLQPLEESKSLPGDQLFSEAYSQVGRDAEFQKLKACIEGVFAGRGQIATLTGERGSGKATLLSQLRQYFAHRDTLLEASRQNPVRTNQPLHWLRGRCRSYNQGSPYSLWLDLFRDWLGLRPEDTREERLARLRQQAEELWAGQLDEHYPYLVHFLGLPLEAEFQDRVRHLDGEGLRRSYFGAVRNWIEMASRRGPLVLSFSDLHWADDSSLALLEHCLPICDSEPLVWILSFLPEREASIWTFSLGLETSYPHRLTRVDLPPLSISQSRDLIDRLIGPGALPAETRDLIIRNSEGNPHYIIELMRALVAQGILVREPEGEREDGPWRATRVVTTLDLPDSLQRLLLSHIDRLEGHERLVLQIAAVIGQVFWSNLVQALIGESATLKADLVTLQRNQFVQESGRVPELGMQYSFRSPLVREAVYDSLLSAQKAQYHLKAASFIESQVSPEVLEDYDGTLAHHYEQAGNPKKALFYTVLAAEQARKLYANAEALRHYNRARTLLDELQRQFPAGAQHRSILTQTFEVLVGRRAVLLDLGDLPAALADTEALLPLAEQLSDDRVWLVDALLARADFPAHNRDELRPKLQIAERALDLSRELHDQRRELNSLVSVAALRLNLREANALSIAEEALDLARRLGDLRTEVSILLRIGNAYGIDNLSRSREYLEAALARSKSLNDKRIEILLLEALGRQFERDGDYYRQLTEYEHKRLALSREIGNRYVEGQALYYCGQIQGLYLGDFESGLAMQHEALRIWESINSRIFPLLRITQILTLQGQYDQALATLEAARPLADKVVMEIGRAGLALVTVVLFNALGDEAHLWSALDWIAEIQRMTTDNLVSRQYRMAASCEAADTRLQLAERLQARDPAEAGRQRAQALEASGAALDLYQQFGFVQIVECTSEEILFRHSQALAANDRPAEAAEYRGRAHQELMRKHDLIPADSPFRESFLQNFGLHRVILAAQARQLTARRSRARRPKKAAS